MASKELSILVTARNLASRALGQVKGDINSLESTAKRASSNLGRNLAIGTAAVGGAIAVNVKSGVDSLVELERVNNLTNAVLESTGSIAGVTADKVRDLAEEYETLTGVDDKVIQNAENLLLTFTNVRDDAFEPTLEAALNLNAALGGGDEGLEGVLMQVAKAMNDPARGLTALRRSGVSFTDAQVKQIKALQESGDLMGAQAIILGELETQFGGAAEAANQGVGGAQKRFADAIEDMQMALATGFLPLIERVSEKMGELVSDESFMQGVEDFGAALASGFEEAIDFAESVDWKAVGNAFTTAGSGARAVMDAFLSAPTWLQTAILTGWGLNKLTGGVVGSLVGELGKGLIKGVLGMNAGVVNINAATVNGGGGGIPGAAGKAGGGLMGGLKTGVALASPLLVGAAAVEVVNFENMRTEQRAGLQGILDEMPRTPEKVQESIDRIQAQIDMERPFLEGLLFNTNIRPQLEAEIAELQMLRAEQAASSASASSTTAAWNSEQRTAYANLYGSGQRQEGKLDSTIGKLANIESIEAGNAGKLQGILNKPTTLSVSINNSVSVTAAQAVEQFTRYNQTLGHGVI